MLGKTYSHTFLTTVIIFALSAASLKVAADFFGSVGFGEYQIARRGIALLTYPLLVGIGVSLPRFIAGTGPGGDNQQTDYLTAGLAIIIVNLAACGILLLSFPAEISRIFFGGDAYGKFILPMYTAVAGLCLYTAVYSHLRGNLKIWQANLFQLLCIGLVPITAIAFAGDPLLSIIYTGIAWIAFAVLYLAVGQFAQRRPRLSGILPQTRKLLVFGLPRIPGEFALFGLFSVPVFSIAHITDIQTAGYFALGFSFLQLICGFFDYVGIILLPLISKMAAEERFREIAVKVKKTLGYSLLGSLALVTALSLFMSDIIGIFFGKDFLAATEIIRWIILGACPYLVYAILRNPLDALVVFPHNSLNLSVVLILMLAALSFAKTTTGCIAAILAGISLLGLLTALSWFRCISAKLGN
jgi:O-antigen/teichoic acid export membrane protein